MAMLRASIRASALLFTLLSLAIPLAAQAQGPGLPNLT